MNALVKSAGCALAYRSGLLAATMRLSEPLGRSSADGRFQVLTYHHVSDVTDPYVSATRVEAFERQIRYLRRNFQLLSLSALLRALDVGQLPARAIAITFDDGYQDTYTHAFPLIRRYDIPVTVYLATGLIDEDASMWNDRVAVAIRDTQRTRLDCVDGTEPMPLSTEAERQLAFARTIDALKYRPPRDRDSMVWEICDALEVSVDRAPRMLNWRQIEEMQRQGVEFGAHTVSHSILTTIAPDEAEREIIASKRTIEERLQTPVTQFAYPNGTRRDFDEQTRAIVKEAGFSAAVSTVFGTNDAVTDRYELRRGGPWEEEMAVFATKLWWYRTRGHGETSDSTSAPSLYG